MFIGTRKKHASALSAFVFSAIAGLAFPGWSAAQSGTMENMLDRVSGSFPSAPMQGPQSRYTAPSSQAYATSLPQVYGQSAPLFGQPTPPGYALPYAGQPVYANPSSLQQASLMPGRQSGNGTTLSPFQRLRSLYGVNNGAPSVPLLNSRQLVLQELFGGGGASNGGNASGSSIGANASNVASTAEKLQIARDNLSTARNQQSRARNFANRASYGSDKGARQEAASSAEYAAEAARAAADRASQAGYNGGPAGDVAAQARAAADDARASADRARSNANGGGW